MFDESDSILIQKFKIFRRMCDFPRFIAHKSDIFNDVVNVFLIFFGGIGVIKSEIAFSTMNLCQHEIKSHGSAVTNVQISIGFRWETSQDYSLAELLLVFLEQFFGIVA